MDQALSALLNALNAEGLPGGLRCLNQTVEHRYTGVYRLRDAVFHNIGLFDKQGEIRPDFLAAVPLGDSFCQFVIRDGVFKTDDSGRDARLDGHKYQGILLTYHGVPLEDDRGEFYGTLCHFDALQRSISDADFAFLQAAARVIPKFLPAAS